MDAAIRAAVVTLLVIAALIVVGVIVKSIIDSRSTFKLGNAAPKMREARTLPSPVQQKSSNATPDVGAGTKGTEKIHTRLTALKVIVAAIMGTLFVKLWSMQVFSYKSWQEASEANRTTSYSTRAVRGRILDRNGKVLAGNRAQITVVASADSVNNNSLVHRLSNVLGIPRPAIRARLKDTTAGAQASRVVATDVSMRVVAFISEHPSIFPGVNIETRTQRTYPYGTIGAHVIGYAGTVSESELANSTTSDGGSYSSGDIVGKSGSEQAFESVLQGVHGTKSVEVDASGNVLSTISEVAGQKGNDIRLCINIDAQTVAEQQLLAAINVAKVNGGPNCKAGGVIGLDLSDGGVVVMASYPTFDPNQFVNGISSELWDSLNTAESGYPLNNRTISGLYPAASTFKGYAAIAGLEEGLIDGANTTSYCTGLWTELGTEWAKKCWLETGHGTINVIGALAHSCDVFFYDLSYRFYQNRGEKPNALQDDVEKYGLASKTGIELGSEATGRIPTADWKASYYKDDPDNAQWLPGDMANLIIGQGDVLITPIQNANGYAAIATGKNYRPHVLKDVLNDSGNTVISSSVEVLHEPEVKDSTLELVREGLKEQTEQNGLFDNCTFTAGGKSGTGQVYGKADMRWFVGYAPVDSPKYVAACFIEEAGGDVDNISTSVVRSVLASLLGVDDPGNTTIASYSGGNHND